MDRPQLAVIIGSSGKKMIYSGVREVFVGGGVRCNVSAALKKSAVEKHT